MQQIEKLKHLLQNFVQEAIAAEQAGLKVVSENSEDRVLPDELLTAFAQKPGLKKAFTALTSGRQRSYSLQFGHAQQSTTRTARSSKCVPAILEGRGLQDAPAKFAKLQHANALEGTVITGTFAMRNSKNEAPQPPAPAS